MNNVKCQPWKPSNSSVQFCRKVMGSGPRTIPIISLPQTLGPSLYSTVQDPALELQGGFNICPCWALVLLLVPAFLSTCLFLENSLIESSLDVITCL